MGKHKCKYEWYPRLAGSVFGCRVCRSITTPEQVITQLEADLELLMNACKEEGYLPDASDRTHNRICTVLAILNAQEGKR